MDQVANPLGFCQPSRMIGKDPNPTLSPSSPSSPSSLEPSAQPFDIDMVVARVREAIRKYKMAALFELAEDGFDSPFEQLVACIISIRTRDEVTVVLARRLFAVARTPEAMQKLTPAAIDGLIASCTFHEAKARQIHVIAERAVRDFGGRVPCDFDVLTSFRGVGPKCANLVLGIACGKGAIGVDIHVHRVTNRWGYVRTKSPEQTLEALTAKLPRAYWVEINRLLVPFGKHICTGALPACSTCPVRAFCARVGVTNHR
jgi:endonuclease III